MSSASPPVLAQTSDFHRRAELVKPSKADINAVIMDYLIIEGYPTAAQKFAVEANIAPSEISTEQMAARVAIRQAILKGDIELAIEKINDFNPEILDTDARLHYSLLRLQHLELIRHLDRTNDASVLSAINFAKSQLAPRVHENPQFIEELEQNMRLLVFDHDQLPATVTTLMDPSVRLEVATRVNEAILRSQGGNLEARIKDLIHLRQWSEQKARDMKKPIPAKLTLGLDPEDWDHDGHPHGLNGSADGDAMIS